MTYTAGQIRDIILDALYPSYEKKFGVRRSANYYNISTLVYGANAYLYYMAKNQEEYVARVHNHHLLRGASIDRHVKASMPPEWVSDDRAYLRWVVPFQWKNRPDLKDIVLMGHYDERHAGENCLLEIKAPEVIKNFRDKGGLLRAKRQVGTYAKILSLKTGKPHQAFVVIVNHEIQVEEVSEFEMAQGFDFVKKAAFQVAQMLDKPIEEKKS